MLAFIERKEIGVKVIKRGNVTIGNICIRISKGFFLDISFASINVSQQVV